MLALISSQVGAVEPASAAASAPAADIQRTIYQQRGPDGRVVFTDRPAAGLATERRWLIDPEDPEAALARREASRADADRVSERIQRSIDQQRQLDNALQIEQLRSQQVADARAAERLRELERERDIESRSYIVRPGRPWHRPPGVQPAPRPQPPAQSRPPPRTEPLLRVGRNATSGRETN